jgi:hypothetical protein
LLIESVDEGVLVGPWVVAECLGAFHHDFVRIKYGNRFRDKLIERHRLFRLAAVHEIGAHPGRSDFEHPNAGILQQKALRQGIRMKRRLCRRVDGAPVVSSSN